jgi:hypothetical protein
MPYSLGLINGMISMVKYGYVHDFFFCVFVSPLMFRPNHLLDIGLFNATVGFGKARRKVLVGSSIGLRQQKITSLMTLQLC